MTICVGDYEFEGPYTDTGALQNRAGVYVIHCHLGNEYRLIDVGESAQVRARVDSHDRKDCWERFCSGALTVSVHYTPNLQQPGRMAIEQVIRSQFRPPCGER